MVIIRDASGTNSTDRGQIYTRCIPTVFIEDNHECSSYMYSDRVQGGA